MKWEIQSPAIEKASLVVMDVLATNNWERPVYFVMNTSPENYIGLENYLHLEGLAYRVMPVKIKTSEGETGEVNTEALYDHLMNKFIWGNIFKP